MTQLTVATSYTAVFLRRTSFFHEALILGDTSLFRNLPFCGNPPLPQV